MSLFRHITASILLTAAMMAQAADDSTFRATTTTVLVPFNVQRGKYLATDLQPSDLVLLEDGHPRQFTIFEGPNTPHPLPLELVLVFDTARIPPDNNEVGRMPVWDPQADYEFLNNWDESATQAVLQQNGMDIRISIYHFDDGHFERLCRASRDPHEIDDAFRRLLSPIPAGNRLTLLPGDHIFHGKDIFSPGWWQEATVAALRDVAGSPIASRRVMFLFSDLDGTRQAPGAGQQSLQAIANEALVLGIEIDPVIMDLYKRAAAHRLIGKGDALPQQFSVPVEMPDGSTWNATAPWSSRLGEMAGGEALYPEHLNRDALGNMLQRIRNRTLSEYLVGFVPQTGAKPGKHKLRVKLRSKTTGKIVGGEREGVVY